MYSKTMTIGISRLLSPVFAFALAYTPMTEVLAKSCCSSGGGEKAQAAAEKDIVDTAVAAGKFNTLAKALGVAGLVENLKGKGPFTVFAPDDDAFAKVPAETLNGLLADKEKLTKVLTYHVVNGEVLANKVVKLKSAKTLEGTSVPIKVTDGKVSVGDANVTATDIKCANGVIHVIDKVLIP